MCFASGSKFKNKGKRKANVLPDPVCERMNTFLDVTLFSKVSSCKGFNELNPMEESTELILDWCAFMQQRYVDFREFDSFNAVFAKDVLQGTKTQVILTP